MSNVVTQLLCVLLLISMHVNALAQAGCKKVERWVAPIRAEYPNTSINSLYGDKLEHAIYNLLSDKYFIPVYKKPFNELSRRKLGALSRTIGNECWKVTPGNHSEIEKAFRSGSSYATNWDLKDKSTPFSYEVVVVRVEEINQLRTELESITADLKADPDRFSLKELNALLARLETDFQKLLPSELSSVSSLVITSQKKAAGNELHRLLSAAIGGPVDYESLMRLANFKTTQSGIFRLASASAQNEATMKLRHRSEEILTALMSKEISSLKALPDDLTAANFYFQEFDKRYSDFKSFPGVSDAYDRVTRRKNQIVERQFDQIAQELSTAEDINQVEMILSKVLIYSDNTNSSLVALSEIATKRKQQIKHNIEQKRLAVERQKQLEKEEAIRQRRLKAIADFNKLMARKESSLTDSETVIIKQDLLKSENFEVYSSDEMDIMAVFLKYFQLSPEIYLTNEVGKKSTLLHSKAIEGNAVSFRLDDSPECTIDKTSGIITTNTKFKIDKVLNYQLWQIAQKCPSVQRIFNSVSTAKFRLTQLVVHSKLTVPIYWIGEVTEGYCAVYGAYDNCRTPCHTYLSEGRANFLFSWTKELNQDFLSAIGAGHFKIVD